MANMGSRKHLKRFKAPKNWSIHPKENKWTVKPSAGPHAIEGSLSLLIVVRDILSLADTAREAKRIINTGKILIDGRISKDYKFPVGFMDIIEIPDTNETYRVLPDAKGRLTLQVIPKENAGFKLCKVSNKTTIEEGKNQLNLHDGRNLLTEEDISVGDVINLKVPEQEITESFSFEEGATVLVTAGKHTGEIGKINEIVVNKSSNPNTIVVENSKKDTFVTLRDYAFVIGKDKAIISLPGGK